MGNTLKDDMKIDAANCFLNTNDFAESVTFYPAAGGASRSIDVRITYQQESKDFGPINYDTERIEVFILKDESHAKGGLATPDRQSTVADKLVRAGDTLTEKFAFTGRILSESAHGWLLEFVRPKPVRIGTQQRA